MLPMFILEPSSYQKRIAYSRTLALPRSSPFPNLEDLRLHLKELRQAAVANLDSLSERLLKTLHSLPRVEVFTANDAQQGVLAIQNICGTTKTIAINQSSVLTQEIAPALRQAGFQVIDSYSCEFPLSENRFAEYYQLPRVTADYLVDSFSASNLARLRTICIERGDAKDFVALLGVNSMSADDGTVFLVQHFHNISKAFQQARKLVLVVALDKIASGCEEARLQAVGTGIFGWEARLLKLGGQGGGTTLDALPSVPSSQADPDLLVIVMDNGRKRLLDGPYKDLLTCIGCRACIRNCPTHQFFGDDTGWSPKEYLYYFVQGQNPSLDLCLNCGMCRVECPLDIDLPGMMMMARARSPVRQTPASALISNFETVARWGCRFPSMTNTALSTSIPRWFADRILGVSKDAPMPTLSRDSLPRWLRVRPGRQEK